MNKKVLLHISNNLTHSLCEKHKVSCTTPGAYFREPDSNKYFNNKVKVGEVDGWCQDCLNSEELGLWLLQQVS